MNNWFNGISYEVAFWTQVFNNKKERQKLFLWSKYDNNIVLKNFDVQTWLSEKTNKTTHKPIILDVGCGLSYCTGNKLNGQSIDIQYVDPLAPF